MFADVCCNLIALESLYESLDTCIVLVTCLDCDDVNVRAVSTFNEETVAGCDEACRNCVVTVDDRTVDILKDSGKGCCLDFPELQAPVIQSLTLE